MSDELNIWGEYFDSLVQGKKEASLNWLKKGGCKDNATMLVNLHLARDTCEELIKDLQA